MEESLKYKILCTGKQLFSDSFFHKAAHYYLHLRKGVLPRKLNINEPRTFNEKIIYNKLYSRFDEGHFLADKYKVRKYVSNVIGEKFLVPFLGIYDHPDDIDFSILPKSFVIKITQGSGWNILIKDKGNSNFRKIKEKLKFWLELDYSIYGREWQYNKTTSKIIIEKYLGEPLYDYKYFCFNGNPKFIQVDIDRQDLHSRNFYDLNWNKLNFSLMYPTSKKDIPPPLNLIEMNDCVTQLAESLKDNMSFARIDFYNQEGKIFFGEITFHPGGGCEPFLPRKADEMVGDFWKM